MELPASFLPQHPFDNGMLDIRDEKLAGFPRTPGEVRKHLADYYAVISHTDAQIGRILEALHRTGKFENTVVVFSSDNGLAVGKHGLMGKQNLYEHSIRVPLIIAGPGIPDGEMRDHLCYIFDIYPTLCERAGLATPSTVQFHSLNDIIDGDGLTHREHLYFAFMSWQRAVRNERFKLIEYCVNEQRYTQLFDLRTDPDELVNLAGNPEFAEQLKLLRNILESEKVLQNDGNTPFDFTNDQGKLFWKTYDSNEISIFPEIQSK
jgi:arylsulfatase A-like enzyme